MPYGAVAVVSSPLAVVGGQRVQLAGRGRRALLRASAAPKQQTVVIGNNNNNNVNGNNSRRGRRCVSVRAQSIQEPETDLPDTWSEDDIDNIEFAAPEAAAISNKEGAGATMAAPDWQGEKTSIHPFITPHLFTHTPTASNGRLHSSAAVSALSPTHRCLTACKLHV